MLIYYNNIPGHKQKLCIKTVLVHFFQPCLVLLIN